MGGILTKNITGVKKKRPRGGAGSKIGARQMSQRRSLPALIFNYIEYSIRAAGSCGNWFAAWLSGVIRPERLAILLLDLDETAGVGISLIERNNNHH